MAENFPMPVIRLQFASVCDYCPSQVFPSEKSELTKGCAFPKPGERRYTGDEVVGQRLEAMTFTGWLLLALPKYAETG